MKIDKKLIKELTDYLNEFKLSELEYGNKDLKIKIAIANLTTANNAKTDTENLSKSIFLEIK